MARLTTVPRATVGVSNSIPAEVLDSCKKLVAGLDPSQAGVVTLDEGDDSGMYRKAFETAATLLGITVQVRKRRNDDGVLHIVKLTEAEAAEYNKRQATAAKKRSATAKAKNPEPPKAVKGGKK